MIPDRKDLLPFIDHQRHGAMYFHVTQKTFNRWLNHYGIFHPTPNYGCNKLDMGLAKEIRKLHAEGQTMTALANRYGVTVAAISRVVHHKTYRENKDTASVQVVYQVEGGNP